MYTLYSIPGSCSTGIAVLLEKLNADYKIARRDDDIADYAALVPTNQVPAIALEDDTILTEGLAIALYLLEKYPNDMLPTDLAEKAVFYQWLNFDYATLHPAYGKLFSIAYKVDLADEVKVNLQQQLADYTASIWAILDRHLANRQFIFGAEPTHADYMATIYASWNHNFPDASIEIGKNVRRLIDEISILPEFRAAYAKEGTEYRKPL